MKTSLKMHMMYFKNKILQVAKHKLRNIGRWAGKHTANTDTPHIEQVLKVNTKLPNTPRLLKWCIVLVLVFCFF